MSSSSTLIAQLGNQIKIFEEEKTVQSYTIDSFWIREFVALIYKSLNYFSFPNKSLNNIYTNLFNSNQEIPSIKFITSRAFLKNLLEKMLMWILLEVFYCKTFVSRLQTINFIHQKTEEFDEFCRILTQFTQKNRVLIKKSSFFLQFDNFLNEKEKSESQELINLRIEWNILYQKTIDNSKQIQQSQILGLNEDNNNDPSVIIMNNPMMINLSDNSNSDSEENTPKEENSMPLSSFGESGLKFKSKSGKIYRDVYKKMNEECKFKKEDGEIYKVFF